MTTDPANGMTVKPPNAPHAMRDTASSMTTAAASELLELPPLHRDVIASVRGSVVDVRFDLRQNRQPCLEAGTAFLQPHYRQYSYGRGGRNAMMFVGLTLIAIGIFLGHLIQAALSRQRELLADASAVQFTRNPAGLSRALQKIGSVGSEIDSPHAAEASHMFFENGISKPFIGWMATHPPLEQRIRAIDPSWNGTFIDISVTDKSDSSTKPQPEPLT